MCTVQHIPQDDSLTCHSTRVIDGDSLTGDQPRTWSAIPDLIAHDIVWQYMHSHKTLESEYQQLHELEF